MKESQRFSITLKYLQEAEVANSPTFRFACPVWPVQKTAGPSQMAVDNYKHNQVIIPVTIIASGVVFLLEQINTPLGTPNASVQQIQ